MRSTILVKLYILYYLLLSSLLWINISEKVQYILLVYPIILFVFLNYKIIIRLKIRKVTGFLLLHYFIVIFIAFFRADLNTVFNASQISLIILILLNSDVNLSYRFINRLFLLGIVLTALAYFLGLASYGFIPLYRGSPEQNWRVALFLGQHVHCTGLFSLLLIVTNYFNNKDKNKWVYIFLGLYFLLFSGSRVAIIAFVFTLFAVFLMNFINIKNKILWYTYPIISVAMIIVIVLIFEVMSFTYSFNTEMLNNMTKLDSPVGVSSYRFWLWQKHMEIFSDNILLGIGDFYLLDMYDNVPAYTESGFTHILVRDGLVSILYFSFLFSFFIYASKYKSKYLYIYFLVVFILIFGIGAITISYSFISFLILGYLASIYNQAEINYRKCLKTATCDVK